MLFQSAVLFFGVSKIANNVVMKRLQLASFPYIMEHKVVGPGSCCNVVNEGAL